MRDIILFISILLASLWLYFSGTLGNFIISLGDFMNLGVLVSGFFYSATVTSPLALAMFAAYGKTMSPLRIAMAAGVGAMFADVIIFLGMGKVAGREFTLAGKRITVPKPKDGVQKALLTALGIVLVALPFPNEIAVVVLGMSGIRLNRFMLLALVSKIAGIFLVAWALSSA